VLLYKVNPFLRGFQGQLLYNQKLNKLSTNVDISQFVSGTYFFKLKINERVVNFKMLKN
jgi:hypothetical protein